MSNLIESKINSCCGFNEPLNTGVVIGPDKERYFKSEGNCHGVNEYRCKFALLSLLALPKGLIALIHRVGDFLRFGSIQRALVYSRISCKKLDFQDLHPVDKKVHLIGLKKIGAYSYNFIAQPAKDLLKIATFPIKLVALTAISLLGVVLPKPGRYLFAKVQRLWEYDNTLEREAFAKGVKPYKINTSMVHYVAPCMQSLEDFNRLNLHLNLPDSNHRELRSLWLKLSHQVERYQDLFSAEVKQSLNERLVSLKEEITDIYPYGGQETDVDGDLMLDGHDQRRKEIEEEMAAFESMINDPKTYSEQKMLSLFESY